MKAKLNVKTITVKLKQNSYPIYIGNNLFKQIPIYLARLNLGNFGIIITSSKIYSLYRRKITKNFGAKNYKIIRVIDGERAKSKKWLFKVLEAIIQSDSYQRSPFIICLGGGTIGDLGGFIAAIYKRGIPYVQIPTTFLAQVDSSIGGKTAIDLPQAKNILGAFYQPKAVFIDPLFLSTLPFEYFKDGLAEVIKYGVVKDRSLFYFLKAKYREIFARELSCSLRMVTVCAKIKAEIVEKDEKEKKSLRTILNFGHTFAHALESSLGYRKISHGQAVSLGMVYAASLSLHLGRCSQQVYLELIRILKLFTLPIKVTFDHRRTYQALLHDKKFIFGQIRMVLLRKIGKVEIAEQISSAAIKRAFRLCLSPYIDKTL